MGYVVAGALLFLVFVLLVVAARSAVQPLSPVNFQVLQIRSNTTMPDILTYRVTVGPVVDSDVVVRKLSVYVDGSDVPRELREYAADTTDLGDVVVPQDTKVVLTLVDVDDAGNESEPATLDFVATDTLPPTRPGMLGVTLVAERSADEPPTT